MAIQNEKLTPLQGGAGTRALATRIETETVLRTGVKRWAAKLKKKGLMPKGKSLEGFEKWMKKSFEYKKLIKEWEDRYGQLMQKGHGRSLEKAGTTAPGTTAPEPGSGRIPIQSSAGEDYIRNMGRSQFDERTLAELRKADIPTNQLEAFRNYLMSGKKTFETFSPEQLARYLHTFEEVDVIIAEAYADSLERAVDPNVTIDAQEIERRLNNNTIREGVSHGGPVTVTKDTNVIDQRLKVAGTENKIEAKSILDKPPPSTFGEHYTPSPTFKPYSEIQSTTLSKEAQLGRAQDVAQKGEIMDVIPEQGRLLEDDMGLLNKLGLKDNKLIQTLLSGGAEAAEAWRSIPKPLQRTIIGAPLATHGTVFDALEVGAREADYAEDPSLINNIDRGLAYTSGVLGAASAVGFLPAEVPQLAVQGIQLVSDEFQNTDREEPFSQYGPFPTEDTASDMQQKWEATKQQQKLDEYYNAGGGNAAMVKHGWSIEQTQQQGRQNLNKQFLSTPERTD